MNYTPGTLIGVGLGPGDPELLTLKAVRAIGEAEVIAYPAANDGPSLAEGIARSYIPKNADLIEFSLPMRGDRTPAQDAYDAAADRIESCLVQGQTTAVLCEGDPLFFGSFMYLAARLAPRFPTKVIPGITSVCAASAATLHPLAARTETLTILPATMDKGDLIKSLERTQSAAILKLGRHVGKVKAIAQSLNAEATYVERATQRGERILALADAPDPAPYFSLALLRMSRDPWLSQT